MCCSVCYGCALPRMLLLKRNLPTPGNFRISLAVTTLVDLQELARLAQFRKTLSPS